MKIDRLDFIPQSVKCNLDLNVAKPESLLSDGRLPSLYGLIQGENCSAGYQSAGGWDAVFSHKQVPFKTHHHLLPPLNKSVLDWDVAYESGT